MTDPSPGPTADVAKRPLRLGTLGVGRIVHRGLVPGVATSTRVELVATASERPGAASAAGLPGVAIDGYQNLLDRGDVDAVYVPARGHDHARWVLQAAAAGKHVLCEKPLGLNIAEAELMAAACRDAHVVLFETFMWRHHDRSLDIRRRVRAGEIGTLRHIAFDFAFQIDPDDWRLDPAQGGGAIYDIGCYGINAARFFTGEEPADVDCDSRLHASGADLSSRIGLTFPGGTLATVACSFERPLRCDLRLLGSDGDLWVPDMALPPDEAHAVLTSAGGEPQTIRYPSCEQYGRQLDAFAAAVDAGTLIDPAEDGLANMRVIERAYAAAGRDVRPGVQT